MPFDCILFEELLHKGAFKIVHHGVVNYPARGMMRVPVAVKRLRGDRFKSLALSYSCIINPLYSDDRSELGMEELMAEGYILRAIHEKVYIPVLHVQCNT